MPKRSISQRIGDQAEHIAQGAFLNAPNWICRSQSHDFGIDLEAELVEVTDGVEELSGALVKLQVKGTLSPIHKNRGYYVRLRTEYLSYANQFRVPVLLLLVNVRSNEIHYLWLQDYLIGREDILYGAKSVLVKVPEENRLDLSFQHQLPEIALGVTEGSQLMAVQKLFEVFSLKYDATALALASELLEHLGKNGHIAIFNGAIDKLIKRGPHLSRVDSQEFGKVLVDLTRRFGDRLDVDQILKMVVRGDTYSLAGLDGLLGLYDGFPDYAKSLDLPRRFDELELHELSWYCQFREAHAELDAMSIWLKIARLETSFETGAGILYIPEEHRDYCTMKWPNRADAVYLQSLRIKVP
ncbi:DUF4365 domain-containing protein [Marivita sp. GX14005]|uniref:DUF4365 domain-containing protein n=1 Tax=Marivita sp. GX14005 TaxID=2942276 RepID=UPI002019E4D7|nr:DUF4365 domain-containing protein [Marivita sp. GX14005]MCL3882987.1 DUF4365 domain-containing protein [Marivita sp. GX14005]